MNEEFEKEFAKLSEKDKREVNNLIRFMQEKKYHDKQYEKLLNQYIELSRDYDYLQSKTDKAIEYCEYNDEDLYIFEPDYDYEENMVDNYEPSNFREELLDILKEDK